MEAFDTDLPDGYDYDEAYDEDRIVEPEAQSPELQPLEQQRTIRLQQELVKDAVDGYYKELKQKNNLVPELGRDYSNFTIDKKGKLRLKAHPNVNLTGARSQPIALSSIGKQKGGADIIREQLGFVDFGFKKALPAEAVQALQTADSELGAAAVSFENVDLQDLGQTAKEAEDAVNKMETTFTDSDSPLALREIRGLDKALQTIRGELTNNLARLSEIDEHIDLEKRKLEQAGNEFTRRRIAERVRNLQDERAARLEAANNNREGLRSQISRIRETISRILNGDTRLADRIRTLFREQGVTIASILTAIGMTITTLVLALTGGGTPTAPSPPTPSPPGKSNFKEWVKKRLEALKSALTKLAEKAGAALPGIIGSAVSWLLNLLAKTTGWLAQNVWTLIVALGGLVFVLVRDWLAQPKHQ